MTTRTAHAVPATGLRPRLGRALETLGHVPLSIPQLLFRLAVAGVSLKEKGATAAASSLR